MVSQNEAEQTQVLCTKLQSLATKLLYFVLYYFHCLEYCPQTLQKFAYAEISV